MTTLVVDDVIDVLDRSRGEEGPIDRVGDLSEVAFNELGVDSLTVMVAIRRLERKYGVDLGEDILSEVKTPGQLVRRINSGRADD